jgi:hypothetical protein
MRPMRLVALVLAALATAACAETSTPAKPPAGGAQASPSAEVAAVLDDFHDAAARADEDRYFGHLDSDSIFLGTDAKERWDKAAFQAYAHPHFAKGKAWTFRAAHRDVVIGKSGDIAWFDESLATEKLGPARGSGVLVKRNGKWVILQYNLTLTVPNERFDVVKEAAEEAKVIGSTENDPVASISWLAGAWIAETPNGNIEETWLPAQGGSMMGSRREIRGGQTIKFETLRIVQSGGALLFSVQPPGGEPANRSSPLGDAHVATFVGTDGPWPQKITYHLDGARLFVRLEGEKDTDPVQLYTMQKAVVRR